MATTCTKSELLARLLNPSNAKKVFKESDLPKTDVAKDDGFEAYKISERASVTDYFTNEDDIQEEILRCWAVLKSAKPIAKKVPEPNPNVKVLPMVLDEAQLTALDYIYIGPTKSGDHMYGIKKAASQSEGKKKAKEAKPAVKLVTMPAAT
eukprot:5582631-Prymnesium_polylepis.2